MWIYHNQNPVGRNVSDCVVRAISLAEDETWDETFIQLSEYARQEGTLLDDVTLVEPYLNQRYDKICYKCQDCNITVDDFIDTHPTGTYLVTMKGHITCIKEGNLYDTWDCRQRKIWCVWKVKD